MFQAAEKSLKFYKSFKGKSKEEEEAIYKELERLKLIVHERKTEVKMQTSDFCNYFTYFYLYFFKFRKNNENIHL